MDWECEIRNNCNISILVGELKRRIRNHDSGYKETFQKILITATTVGPEMSTL